MKIEIDDSKLINDIVEKVVERNKRNAPLTKAIVNC
jgi:hypothetical protein